MPMPDDTSKEEAKLERLAQAVQAGWAKRHPLTEKHSNLVRDAVRKEWELSPEKRRQKAEKMRQEISQAQQSKQDQGQRRSR